MTLRLRLTLVATAVVAVVLGAASLTVYYVMRHDLFRQVDAQHPPARGAGSETGPRSASAASIRRHADYVAVVGASRQGRGRAPRSRSTRRIKATASGREQTVYFRTTVIEGHHWREIVAPLLPPFSGAVVVAQPVDDVVPATSTACG